MRMTQVSFLVEITQYLRCEKKTHLLNMTEAQPVDHTECVSALYYKLVKCSPIMHSVSLTLAKRRCLLLCRAGSNAGPVTHTHKEMSTLFHVAK